MSDMFRDARSFNQPLRAWDVGEMTRMTDLFYHADVFNQSVGEWDVRKVADMEGMHDALCYLYEQSKAKRC